MSYAIFDNIKTFNVWHNNIKTKLNYPIYGKNALTDEIDEKHAIINFTSALINADDSRVIANVEDQTKGLTLVIRDEYPEWVSTNWIPIIVPEYDIDI
jgi:hypothetical protein